MSLKRNNAQTIELSLTCKDNNLFPGTSTFRIETNKTWQELLDVYLQLDLPENRNIFVSSSCYKPGQSLSGSWASPLTDTISESLKKYTNKNLPKYEILVWDELIAQENIENQEEQPQRAGAGIDENPRNNIDHAFHHVSDQFLFEARQQLLDEMRKHYKRFLSRDAPPPPPYSPNPNKWRSLLR